MAPTVFASPQQLLDAAGRDLGVTDWIEITQERVDTFADATDDHQWIHVDPERAKTGPFGTTIAHGYLTLALVNRFMPQLVEIQNISMGLNYGLGKVRFPAPVPVGARVRGRGEVVTASEVSGGVQVVIRVTVELEGSDRPAAVVEAVSRYLDA